MEPDDWVELTPPSGGLGRLRQRLDAPEVSAALWPRWGVAGLAVALAVVVIAARSWGPATPAPMELALDPVWMHLDAPAHGVRVSPEARGRMALVQVPVSTPGVHMVRVAGTGLAGGDPAGQQERR